MNAAGDVLVAFLRSGVNDYLGTAVVGMRRGALRFGPMQRLRLRSTERGDCALAGTSGPDHDEARGGDYIGVAVDPRTDDFWVSGEHTTLSPTGGRCLWATSLARVGF